MISIEYENVNHLTPFAGNSRTHSDEQIDQIVASIKEFGWTNPLLIDADGTVIAGHGRLMAAKKLGLEEVPVIVLDHLTDVQQQALVIADNKLALNAGWDDALLSEQLLALANEEFDLNAIGFGEDDLAEIIGDVYEPVYNPTFDTKSVTDRDVERASVDIANQIEGIKADKSEKAVEVICPYCAETFNVTGY